MSDSQISPESEPQIQQDVQGDSNQVIGQAIDSIVIKNLTIYERVPKSSAPAAVTVIQPLTQQEYRQRQILLNKVREYWVKGVLGTSLHARVLIELGLQERLDLVPHPFSDITEFVEAPGQVLPEGTQTTDVFDRMVIGRTLLILGEPGSGKTVTLLKLAEDLITRTEQDFGQPIPVVFNLSSWTRKLQTIEEWLEQELLEKYKVSRALGKAWVETEALILLLDGLDEVKAEQRNACVKALNQFMQIHGTTELVICSRLQDYQLLAEPLTLRSAICIQPLTSRQINSFFEQAGMQLSTLKIILNKDEMLHNLATTPLILSIMSLAYQDCKPEEITLDGGTEEYHRRLFNTYIERMFQRRKTSQVYKKKESKDWLIWLAKQMNYSSQTIFFIEQLQPRFLENKFQKRQYRLLCGLIGGAFVGISNRLISILTNSAANHPFEDLIAGCTFGLIIGSLNEIRTVETLRWSWNESKKSLRFAFISSYFSSSTIFFVYCLFIIKLTIENILVLLLIVLILGAFVGLVFCIIGGFIGGFKGSKIEITEYPNQGIVASARNAIIFGSTIGLIWGLAYGLRGGLFYGLLSGLIGGATACIQHYVLRFVLHTEGYVPFKYSQFLNYATDRLFLQKVGGGYIFVHRMLMEHFAEMSPEKEQY